MPPTSGPDARYITQALADHEGALLRYAVRLTGDSEAAQDIVQETFLRLCRADMSKVGDHVSTWLFHVCRNLAVDYFRKESRMHL